MTVCKGFLWERDPGRLWPSKRLFRFRTFDAVDWEGMSLQKLASIRPLVSGWYWRPGKEAERSYNTYGQVATLDHMDHAGLCLECGGKRQAPKCSCGPGGSAEGAEHGLSAIALRRDFEAESGE